MVSRGRNGQLVGQRGNQRVQDQRPVRADDALGSTGRARGVAHRRRAAVVERGPVDRLTGGDQCPVVEHPGRSLAGARDDDDVRESASSGEGFEHFQQRLVNDKPRNSWAGQWKSEPWNYTSHWPWPSSSANAPTRTAPPPPPNSAHHPHELGQPDDGRTLSPPQFLTSGSAVYVSRGKRRFLHPR